MSLSLISDIPPAKYYLHQKHQQKPQHKPPGKHRDADSGGKSSHRIKQKYPQYLLAYSIITILVYLCWLPDFIVALKDVSVTIPQAVKRGSNAMLTCNYDMENDTLYSVKWYKGRREFYRYTPKENPAMKVFPSQSGLNVERNLSNQSHVVLLAVPLNISGKFTCEISAEAPLFQTAMVSGEMEVVELPEEQATVTGIQPRYRIGDLVDGNCSIKYSKPAANLTWTINGIVVPPHHIKTYQIEKYEETNLESVMSAIHFMVTTQHFIKGQMRLKCTASIFDIFKEEIESIIEEDRPRIMASGQSYPPDHGYGGHGDGDGYEHNESYLTYFSAPKSSASRSAEFILWKFLKFSKQKIFKSYNMPTMLADIKKCILESPLMTTLVNGMKNYLFEINQIEISPASSQQIQIMLSKYITTLMVILFLMIELLRKSLRKRFRMTDEKQVAYNCTESIKQMPMKEIRKHFQSMNLWQKMRYRLKKANQHENEICYQDANNDDGDDDCQAKCEEQKQQQQQQHDKHCLVATNQNVVNEKFLPKDTNITTVERNKKKTIATRATLTIIDCQHQMSQTLAVMRLHSPRKSTYTMPALFTSLLPGSSSLLSWTLSSSSSSASASSSSSSLSSTTLDYRKTYAHDSFPLYTSLDASKSNNAKYMSKDQTLLMTSTVTAAMTPTAVDVNVDVAATDAVLLLLLLLLSKTICTTTSNTLAPSATKTTTTTTHRTYTYLYKTSLSSSPLASASLGGALVLESKLLQTSVVVSSLKLLSSFSLPLPSPPYHLIIFFVQNNCLMAFIGELLLHQC